ncbi:MAG: metallophosphoesterase [Oscillospiraceae bacterium]|nr:metallophosphoesterase [Oscillospiraceae bacterium]
MSGPATFSVGHPRLSDSARTIVISDIHGNLSYLEGLLKKLRLRPDDQLILLGDLVEKGPESLGTLRYILSLRKKCRLYPVLGNCDFWHLWVDGHSQRWFDGNWDTETLSHLLRLKRSARGALLLDMCEELGIVLSEDTDIPGLKAQLREGFGEEFDFLASMPYALETEKYIFVHGGIPKGETLESAGAWKCMKQDNFYAQRPHFRKWVIVGHTPVCLYGAGTISAVPIIDPACRLISIDGGCVLKDDGQLNALIIRRGKFSVDWYDPFPLARALTPQKKGPHSAYIRWGDNEVFPLELGRSWCRIRHVRTGYEMDVPTDFLFESNGVLRVNDVTDYRPAVAPGDVLSVVRQTDRGYWIKKNGVTGWYSGELEYL